MAKATIDPSKSKTNGKPQGTVDQLDPAVTNTPASLFRYSTWVHVGPGADGCDDIDEQAGTNDCSDPLHFHAWCRLPNQFQHKEIREKALAAKARRVRQLRDPQSDAAAVLEEEIEALARGGDGVKVTIVEQLAGKEWWRDYTEAVADVREQEDDKGEPLFEHIERDQARYAELGELPAADRPEAEFTELERHLATYEDAVTAAVEERNKPRREALDARDLNDLLDMLRDDRIEGEAMQEFVHIYNTWEWFAGTLTVPRGKQRFESLAQMQEAAPEVIEALQATFDDLERTRNRGAQGNS